MLPIGYTRCEYIEGTGTQKINTHIQLFNYSLYGDTSIKIKCNFTNVKYNYNTIWDTTLNSDRYESWIYADTRLAYRYNNSNLMLTQMKENIDYVLEYYTDGAIRYISFNGIRTASSCTQANFEGELGLWNSTAGNTFGKYKLYYVELKSLTNNEILFNGIPCLDEYGRPCLYDTVTKQPFYNQGSGEFLYKIKAKSPALLRRRILENKRELPIGYKRCEYLESTGTQYIDTLFNATSLNLKIEGAYDGSTRGKDMWGFSSTIADRYWFTAYSANEARERYYIGTRFAIAEHYYIKGEKNIISVETTSASSCKIIKNGSVLYNSSFGGSFINEEHNNFMLFTIGGGTTYVSSRKTSSRLWYFKIWQDGVLVRNYIPCLDRSNNPCLYDTVTKQPFYNQGSGEFSYKLT